MLDGTTKQSEPDESSSPRGVLEVPVSSSSDSDNSSISSCSSVTDKSSVSSVHRALFGDYQRLQWRSLIENIKWKSVRRFSTIPLLGGYDISKKNLRRKLWRNRSADEKIDCGDIIAPKPSWRNFTHAELVAATENFSSGERISSYSSLFYCFLVLCFLGRVWMVNLWWDLLRERKKHRIN